MKSKDMTLRKGFEKFRASFPIMKEAINCNYQILRNVRTDIQRESSPIN